MYVVPGYWPVLLRIADIGSEAPLHVILGNWILFRPRIILDSDIEAGDAAASSFNVAIESKSLQLYTLYSR